MLGISPLAKLGPLRRYGRKSDAWVLFLSLNH